VVVGGYRLSNEKLEGIVVEGIVVPGQDIKNMKILV
jgi:hypothetical protein